MSTEFDLAIAIIATRNYLTYASELAVSISQRFEEPRAVKVCIFTDKPEFFSTLDLRTGLEIVRISSYGWPEATLLRYQIISEFAHVFTSKISMYIDADAVISKDIRIVDLLEPLTSGGANDNGISLVLHPGYTKRNVIVSTFLKTFLGPWEHRRKSLAYVPLKNRQRYFCGGVYWGYTAEFLEMCGILSDWTTRDLNKGVMAKFHDESYLNKWSVLNAHAVVGPEWAHAAQLRHIRHIEARISVLVKPPNFVKGQAS